MWCFDMQCDACIFNASFCVELYIFNFCLGMTTSSINRHNTNKLMSYCFKNSQKILNMVLIDILKSRWLTLEGFCTEVEIMEKDKYKNSSHCWGIKSLLQPHLCELLAEAVNSVVNKALRGQQSNKPTLRQLELFFTLLNKWHMNNPTPLGLLLQFQVLWVLWWWETFSEVVYGSFLQSNCFSPHFKLANRFFLNTVLIFIPCD